jgi:hypothetical protein
MADQVFFGDFDTSRAASHFSLPRIRAPEALARTQPYTDALHLDDLNTTEKRLNPGFWRFWL